MVRRFIVSLLLSSLLILGINNAHAFLFGVIGDSMSTAANTEDTCNDAVECLDNMGTDPKYSFAHGQPQWSLLNRLKTIEPGLFAARSEAENGKRWRDAPDQAQALMAINENPNIEIRIVHIEMGANDVCSDTLPTIEELAEIEFYIDETFTTLTDNMVNGAVIVSEVPNIVRVRDIYRTKSHFLFDTFQDLWDFNTNNLRGDAVDDICKEFFSGFLCGTFGFDSIVELVLEEGLEEIIDQNDAHFPCQRVLGSGSTDLDRQQARELNQQINGLLAVKVQEYDGRNDNAFYFADNVDEGEFTEVEISKLDGFHLGKAGQEWLSGLIWESIGDTFEVPPKGYKQVSGSVFYRGIPLCALVLANGRHMFSCSGDGSYKMWVPLDANGEITLFAFASGFIPFRMTGAPDVFQDFIIEMSRPDSSRVLSVLPTSISSTGGRTTISGTISYNEIPVCALILANGQHMFSCGDNLGIFSLDVPLNAQGKVRLFGFASGFPPFVEDY